MLRHILVPLDGSQLAESVLPAAAALATCFTARLTLLHVLETAAPETIHGQPHLTDPARAQAYLEGLARHPLLAGCAVDVHVHETRARDVAASVVNHAEELGSDLIVLATHGERGLRGLLFGRLALRALQRGTTPILLVRPLSTAPTAFRCRTILVALDGSTRHEPSVPMAAELANGFGAAVALVTVVPTVATLTGSHAATAALLPSATRQVLDLAERQTATYLQEKENGVRVWGVAVRSAVSRGDPVTALLEAARTQQADLVVMATHGKGPLDAFWSGSLTPKVMETLEPPLLLVRADPDPPSEGRASWASEY
jgi:nucleotide-binding universal stress UspA family protein